MKITARILIVVLTAGSAACTTTQQRVGGSSRWMAFLALSTPGQREPLQVLGLELLLRLRSSGELSSHGGSNYPQSLRGRRSRPRRGRANGQGSGGRRDFALAPFPRRTLAPGGDVWVSSERPAEPNAR